MKAWYDDIDSATLQRIKTYSAFNDAMSKNLMVQTMYEYREKEVQDFKETNHELAETCIARKKRIAELEKKNAELNKKLSKAEANYDKMFWNKNEIISKAKEIIKMLHSDCYSIAECEDTNLGLWEDDLAKAEQFLKEE